MVEEQDYLSLLIGLERYDSLYSLSEFTSYLDTDLSYENLMRGPQFVFWRAAERNGGQYHHPNSTSCNTEIKERIRIALKHIAANFDVGWTNLVQFWAAKVDGGHHFLTTSGQPFYVCDLRKGLCWYRKLCMDYRYNYVVEDDGANEEQPIGPVGRVYRNKHPESSPDLRLYATSEFPLRDSAARCGLRKYLALPVFDVLNNECHGVLELLSFDTDNMNRQFPAMSQGLQEAGLRSTHIHFLPINRHMEFMPPKYKQQPESKITKMMELAIEAVPQLHLAQVWVPCKQCATKSNNFSCMERSAFINFEDKKVNLCERMDFHMYNYLQACEFQNLQTEKGIARALMLSKTKSCFCQNLCDVRISENPLVHYAQKARLSLYFAFCVESVKTSSDIYVIEFFLQSNCREDPSGYSSLSLLLGIIQMELKSCKFGLGGQIRKGLVVQLRQPNAIQYESIECVKEIEGHGERYSRSDFRKYLQTELRNLRPSKKRQHGWIFGNAARKELSEDDFNSKSSLVTNLIKRKIKILMNEITSKSCFGSYCLVQFWAPKMEKGRRYLVTSDQPYALSSSYRGLAFFRKQCMKHRYVVDEGAKEDELGPPGRVFRNGHPEVTPDICLYSTRQFSLRNHAIQCNLREYNALPVFYQQKFVGVLEFVGFSTFPLEVTREALTAADLSSAHINLKPCSPASHPLPANITEDQIPALTEVKEALQTIDKIPQVYKANVWVPYGGCANVTSNMGCWEMALHSGGGWEFGFPARQIHAATGKGIIGMVLASEDKSCFCRNLCDFSITEQHVAHFWQRERLDVCFAICLQSSYTGNLLYVVEFFLNQGPATYEYLLSFLKFLIPIMKQKLKSFKVASGKQLGQELAVEVMEFSEAVKLIFSETEQPDTFPVKFKTVQYSRREHPRAIDQRFPYDCDGTDSATIGAPTKECTTAADNSEKEDVAKKTEKGKEETGLHLQLEDLEPHFGKRLEDVAEELGVGRSTIKRALRKHGIARWPNNKKYKKNPSLFMKGISASEIAGDSQQAI